MRRQLLYSPRAGGMLCMACQQRQTTTLMWHRSSSSSVAEPRPTDTATTALSPDSSATPPKTTTRRKAAGQSGENSKKSKKIIQGQKDLKKLEIWHKTKSVLKALETTQGLTAKDKGAQPGAGLTGPKGGVAAKTGGGETGEAVPDLVHGKSGRRRGPARDSQVQVLSRALNLLKTALVNWETPSSAALAMQLQHVESWQQMKEQKAKTAKKQAQPTSTDEAKDKKSGGRTASKRTGSKGGKTGRAGARLASATTARAAKTDWAGKRPLQVDQVTGRELALTAVAEESRGTVPQLQYGLDRALFNPGVYHLQDPRSRVYNFDPYLATIMPVQEFDFNALKQYVTSSKDATLLTLAREVGQRYAGSTSSMTSMLAHFHFLLSGWRPINPAHTSRGFTPESLGFTRITKAPAATFLHCTTGADGTSTYAIDADKEFDTANVLSMLGKSMEKLLTLGKAEFEKYRVTKSHELTEAARNEPEAFHYSTFGDFLMRSQLDAYDGRLPGTGMFDLKTRAVVSVRMDAQDMQGGVGYEIRGRIGQWESFEREYFDMIRSAFLKYALQVRMGRMDGIYVAFHNTQRIFGFQYVSIDEMDLALHSTADGSRVLGDQEFLLSLHLLNTVLDRATRRFPGRSLRVHIETRPSANAAFMYVFAKPVDAVEIDEVQASNKASIEAFERSILGIRHDGVVDSTSDTSQAVNDAAQALADADAADAVRARAAADAADIADTPTSLDVWESMRQKVEETMENEAQGLAAVRDAIEDALEQSGLLDGRSPDEIRAYVDALLSAVTLPDTASAAERILGEGVDEADGGADETDDAIIDEGVADEVEDVEAEAVEAADVSVPADDAIDAESAHDGVEASCETDVEAELEETDTEAEADALEAIPHAASSPSITLKDLIMQLAARVEVSQENDVAVAAAAAAAAADDSGTATAEAVDGAATVNDGVADTHEDAPRNKRFERILSELLARASRGRSAKAEADGAEGDAGVRTGNGKDKGEEGRDGGESGGEGAGEAEGAAGELLGMVLTVRNKVNGRYVVRPENLRTTDTWTVEYAIEEMAPGRRTANLYGEVKRRRKALLAGEDGSGSGGGGGGSRGRSPTFGRDYLAFLRKLSSRGRLFREEENAAARGRPVHVYGDDLARSYEEVFGAEATGRTESGKGSANTGARVSS